MISEQNFTKASIVSIQAEAQRTREFLRRAITSKVISVDEVIDILSKNQAMMEYAASEMARVLDRPAYANKRFENPVGCLKTKVMVVQSGHKIH